MAAALAAGLLRHGERADFVNVWLLVGQDEDDAEPPFGRLSTFYGS